MNSIADPGELAPPPPPSPPPSFDEFQRQTSLMTSCTLLWQELSDHFTSLEQNLAKKSADLRSKIQALDTQTKLSLDFLEQRESTLSSSISLSLQQVEKSQSEALIAISKAKEVQLEANFNGEVDDLKSLCVRMDCKRLWGHVIVRKKEIEGLRVAIPEALGECVDPAKIVLDAISEVFPEDKRGFKGNDLGWACVLLLESLVPVMEDRVMGKKRMMVTPSVKGRAEGIAEVWKRGVVERGGVENVKTPDVHSFLQLLVTFGIVVEEDLELYRKLVMGCAWRKQMPKLAVSLGLGDKMPGIVLLFLVFFVWSVSLGKASSTVLFSGTVHMQ